MEDIKLYWQSGYNEYIDITQVCSDITWSESDGSHTMEMSFKLNDDNRKYMPQYRIAAGDKLKLVGENTEYDLIVTKAGRAYPVRSIGARDFCWYVEENDIAMQFKGESCKKAIEMICNELGIEADIAEMNATVTGVYIESAEDAIEEILDIQKKSSGYKYDFEMRGKRLYVYRLSDEAEYFGYKPAINVNEYDVAQHHSRVSYEHSIENLKNSVRATIKSGGEDSLPGIEYIINDDESIKKYGMLRENFNVNQDKQKEIEVLAKNELTDKNKPERTIKTDMPGNIKARKNRVMNVIDEYTELDCAMRIKNVKHSLSGGIHTMELSLEFVKENESTSYSNSKVQRAVIEEKSSGSGDYNALYEEAIKYLGVPYVWGGYSKKGFDCSGFVSYVLKNSGVWNISRKTAQGLYDATKRVSSPQPGDLVFWANTNPSSPNTVTHVGICIGGGKNIQASSVQKKVCICSNSGAYGYGRY